MSLNKEIEELDKERLAAGKKSREHYASLDLPGARVKGADAAAARKRIAALKADREEAHKAK